MLIFQINIVENGGDRREPPRIVDPEGKYKARKIDKVSRKIFPMAFVLFNIVYWIMYTISFSTSDHPLSRYVRWGVACSLPWPVRVGVGVACIQPQPIRIASVREQYHNLDLM